jgi:hypothetical protein
MSKPSVVESTAEEVRESKFRVELLTNYLKALSVIGGMAHEPRGAKPEPRQASRDVLRLRGAPPAGAVGVLQQSHDPDGARR